MLFPISKIRYKDLQRCSDVILIVFQQAVISFEVTMLNLLSA